MKRLLPSVLGLAVLSCLGLSAASAEEPRHISIYVDGDTSSQFGESLAFEVRERFRQSTLFRVVETEQESFYQIHLRTIEVGSLGASAYSVVVTSHMLLAKPPYDAPPFNELYLVGTTGYCGHQIIQSCAESIFDAEGNYIESDSNQWVAAFKQAFPAPK